MDPWMDRDLREQKELEHERLNEKIDRFVPPAEPPPSAEDVTAFVKEVPEAEYHAQHEWISRSMLMTFRQSRVAYYHQYVAKDWTPPPKRTKAMDIGTLAHAAILEPERFEEMYTLIPEELLASNGAISTKEAKAFVETNEQAGRIVLKRAEYGQLLRIRDSFASSAVAPWLAKPKWIEHAVYWVDSETGLWLRARPDWLIVTESRVFALDIKCTEDPSPAAFKRKVEAYQWMQPAHYMNGLRHAFPGLDVEWLFVAIGSEFPHQVALHQIANQPECERVYRNTLHCLMECYDRNEWRDAWTSYVNLIDVRQYVLEEV